MDANPRELDGGKWVQLARFAVVAGTLLSTVTAAILLTVDPPKQCPNWHLNDKHSTSLWAMSATLILFLLVPACFIAFRWNSVARRAAKHQRRKMLVERLFGRMTPPPIPVTYFMVNVCIAASLLSQLPLFALITQCRDWLRL